MFVIAYLACNNEIKCWSGLIVIFKPNFTRPRKHIHNFEMFSYFYTPMSTKWHPINKLKFISNRRSHSMKLLCYIAKVILHKGFCKMVRTILKSIMYTK